jgi:hypothetical protein
MLVSPEAPGVKPPAPGAFPFSFNRRLGIGPRIQHAVHRPIEPLAHILGAATGRLRSSGVVHLAARRIRRNQAVVDAFEQNRGGLYPILRISCEPTDEVAVVITASGIQGAASALLGRAHLALARSAPTGAFAAVLTKGRYAEVVGHRYEI